MSAEPQWIDLDGAANVRDVGGLPTEDGKEVRAGRLIRSDNLQGLTPADVERLVVEHGVRNVADLRTLTEVNSEGSGPLAGDARVRIEHLSLFPASADVSDVQATDSDDGPVVLPWQKRSAETDVAARRSASQIYQSYLDDRPDSVVAALRLIAHSDGATLVHCAAGKDRTGVVVALALDAVGVERSAIVDDFVRSGDRMKQIIARLTASRTYVDDIKDVPFDRHIPQRATMETFLANLDDTHGGTSKWLREHGWTDDDADSLRAALVAE